MTLIHEVAILSLVLSVRAQGFGGGFGGFSGFGSSGSGFGGFGSGGSGFGGSFDDFLGFDVSKATTYRSAHGILAAVAFVGLFPLGAILLRVVPGRFAWVVHAATQVLAYFTFIAGAALGIYLVTLVKIPPQGASLIQMSQTQAHPIIGLVVLGLVFFQPVLGWVHHTQFKRLGRRTAWSHIHLWVGRVAITLGMINGGLGLGLAGAADGAKIAYAVCAAAMWAIWAATAVFSECRRRRASRAAPKEAGAGGASPPYTPHDPRSHRRARADPDVEMTPAKPRVDRSVSPASSAASRVAHP